MTRARLRIDASPDLDSEPVDRVPEAANAPDNDRCRPRVPDE